VVHYERSSQAAAFELADTLVVSIYSATRSFPRDEQFGLTSQIRRAAVSIASNVVEGCARRSQADYVRFLDMPFAAAREVEYQLTIAERLGYLSDESGKDLSHRANEAVKVLGALVRSCHSKA
jgi:four helix bundle protein